MGIRIISLIVAIFYFLEATGLDDLALGYESDKDSLRPMALRNSSLLKKAEITQGVRGKQVRTSNAIIEELLGRQIIVEVEYDGNTLKAWIVRDFGEGYRVDVTPPQREEGRRGEKVFITRLFTKRQQKNLIEWIRRNALGPYLKDEPSGETGYVRYRIALNETALKLQRGPSRANKAHIIYRGGYIYIGEYLLKYLLKDEQSSLREEVFAKVISKGLKEEAKYPRDKPYIFRSKKLKKAIRIIESTHRRLERKLYNSLLLKYIPDRLKSEKSLGYAIKITYARMMISLVRSKIIDKKDVEDIITETPIAIREGLSRTDSIICPFAAETLKLLLKEELLDKRYAKKRLDNDLNGLILAFRELDYSKKAYIAEAIKHLAEAGFVGRNERAQIHKRLNSPINKLIAKKGQFFGHKNIELLFDFLAVISSLADASLIDKKSGKKVELLIDLLLNRISPKPFKVYDNNIYSNIADCIISLADAGYIDKELMKKRITEKIARLLKGLASIYGSKEYSQHPEEIYGATHYPGYIDALKAVLLFSKADLIDREVLTKDLNNSKYNSFNTWINRLIKGVWSNDVETEGEANLYSASAIKYLVEAGLIDKPKIKSKLKNKISYLVSKSCAVSQYPWRSNLVGAIAYLIEAGLVEKKDISSKEKKKVIYRWIKIAISVYDIYHTHYLHLLKALVRTKSLPKKEIKKIISLNWDKIEESFDFKTSSDSPKLIKTLELILRESLIDKTRIRNSAILDFLLFIIDELGVDELSFKIAALLTFLIENNLIDSISDEETSVLEDMKINKSLEHLKEAISFIHNPGFDATFDSLPAKRRFLFSVYPRVLHSIKSTLLTKNFKEAKAEIALEAVRLLAYQLKKLKRDGKDKWDLDIFEDIIDEYLISLFGPYFDSEEIDISKLAGDIMDVLTEKGSLVDLPAIYTLVNKVLKDSYIKRSLKKLSQGAGINLKLKAYYMLWKEEKSSEEVIKYLKKRIKECLSKEKALKKKATISCEIEVWKSIKGYPVKSAKFLAKLLNMNLGDSPVDSGIAIEFSPQPARDWIDVAETLDTMKALRMIPTEKKEEFSLHIVIGNPKGTNIKSNIFKQGVSLITFLEAFLTSVDERLLQYIDREVLYDLDAVESHHGRILEVVKGERLEADSITHYVIGNFVSDRRLEFKKDILDLCHRRALRMVQNLHTALLAYTKTRKENLQEELLSELYAQLYTEIEEFLLQKNLYPFLKETDKKRYIERMSSRWYIYQGRTLKLRKEMEAIVEKYVRQIEEIRTNPALKKAPAFTKEERVIENVLSDHSTNIRLAYLMLADTLKKCGYNISDSDTDAKAVMKKEIELVDIWDLPFPDSPKVGIFLDSVPGAEITGIIAQKRKAKVNFLYILPDKNLYTNGQTIFVRYMVFIDQNGRLRMGRFKVAQPLSAIVHEGPGLNYDINRFFDKKNVALLNPDTVMEFCEDKANIAGFLKKHSLASPRYTVIRKGSSVKEAKEILRYFIEKENIKDFVLKPVDGSEGEFVEMFDRSSLDSACLHAEKILRADKDIIVQKRIMSRVWYLDGKRIDWNIRALSTWRNGKVVVEPDMIEVRYKAFDSKPVNYAKGAKIFSLPQFFKKIGLSPEEQKKFIEGITGLIKPAMRTLFAELKRRNPKIALSKLRPGFVGWDLIQSKNGKWYIIEVNTGQVGGMLSLEKIYNRVDEKRRGNAVMPFIRYLGEIAKKAFQEMPEEAYKDKSIIWELDVSNEPGLLFDIGYAYSDVDNRKAAIIFDKVVRLNKKATMAWYNLGVVLYNLGDYAHSEEALRRAVELELDNKEFWFDLADTLYCQKKYDEANQALKEALKIDPAYEEAKRLFKRVSSLLERRAKSSHGSIWVLQEYRLNVEIAQAA